MEYVCRSTDEIEEYQRVSSHVGKGLASIQKELHRMRVATKTQVEKIEIKREVIHWIVEGSCYMQCC
jgi:hypothetical protein